MARSLALNLYKIEYKRTHSTSSVSEDYILASNDMEAIKILIGYNSNHQLSTLRPHPILISSEVIL